MAEGQNRNINEEGKGENLTTSPACSYGRICKLDNANAYEVAGGKLSLHGISYQRKLLMLFALRSILKHKKFKLATEMKSADTVDDVILIYPKDNGIGNMFRFLQAKHRIGNKENMRKISATDLLKETKDDFSISKYFRAYLNIVDNCELFGEGDEILDLIICTNTGLWLGSRYEDFILTDDWFEGVDEEDFIFGKTHRKFKQEFPGRKKIVLLLMNCFSELPRNFAKSTSIGKTYDHPKNVNAIEKQLEFDRLYEIVFLEEVVDLKTKTFREDFILGVNLSGIGEHFRNCLISEWETLNDEGSYENWLKTKMVEVSGISEDNGLKVKSVSKKLSESVRKNLSKKIINICDEKSVLFNVIDKLKILNVLEMTEGGLGFSKQFLCTDSLCETANSIKKEIINNLSHFKIESNALEDIKFVLDDKLGQSKTVSIGDFKPEYHVEQFLAKLVFALDQPNETKLGIIVKNELKPFLVGCDVETVYSKLYRWIDEWLSSPKGKYLTEEDFKSFFNDLKEEVFFDLRDPVSNFTGRSKELNELHEALFQDESRAAIISQTASISGLGGIGKSELARMYAKVYRREFHSIIWIESQSQISMESSFRRLAYDRLNISAKNSNGEDKKIESIVEEVYQKLEGKRNLFVFDNAEQLRSVGEGSNGIQKYISPSSKGNYYIITSRNRKWGDMTVLNLDKFTDQEAIQFLKSSFGKLDDFNSEDCMKLANALGNFPLAMQQAVAYIKETSDQFRIFNKNFTISDYLEVFHAKSKELLQHEFSGDCNDNYTKTSYTTMKISIESISSKEYGSLSVKILNVMAYLCPERIESSLLLNIFKGENDLSLSKALLLLHQYSMISLEGSTARVHRLLQLVVRITLKEEGLQKEVLKSIMDCLKPSQLDHSLYVWKYVSEYEELVKLYVVFSIEILVYLICNVDDAQRVVFGVKLESVLRDIFGYYHPHTSYVRSMVGVALVLNNKAEGFTLIQSNFEEQREFLGNFHPVTLCSQRFISEMGVGTLGILDHVTISRGLLDKSNFFYGEDYEFTIEAKSILANLLYKSMNHHEALKLFEEIITKHNKPSSPKVYHILCNAELMVPKIKVEFYEDYNGTFEEFERKFDEFLRKMDIHLLGNILPIIDSFVCTLFGGWIIKTFHLYYNSYTELYGNDEPYLTLWRLRYGIALSYLGFHDSALKEFQEIYVKQKQLTNEKHRKVLETKFWIATTFCKKENHGEALRLHKEVLDVREELYGPNDPDTLESKSSVAIEHSHLGDHEAAISLLEKLAERAKADQKCMNKFSNNFMIQYADALMSAGKCEQAALQYSQFHKLQVECYGERNLSSLQAGLKYSHALYEFGDRKKSLEVLNRVRHVFSEMDVKEDTLPCLSLNMFIASELGRLNMHVEEKFHLLKILKTSEILLGRNHSKTLSAMCRLAVVECNLYNFHNVRELVRDIETTLPSTEIGEKEYLGVKMLVSEVHMKLNELQKSLKVFREVQRINEKRAVISQERITNLMSHIAFAMNQQGEFEESLNLLREIISIQSSTLGSDHRETLKTVKGIVIIFYSKGDLDGAMKECSSLFYRQKKSLGKNDKDTLTTKSMIGELVALKGNVSEGIESIKKCHKKMCDKFGESDVESIKVKLRLGLTLCNIGNSEEGKVCLFDVYKKQKDLLGEGHMETVLTKQMLNVVLRRLMFGETSDRYLHSFSSTLQALDVVSRYSDTSANERPG